MTQCLLIQYCGSTVVGTFYRPRLDIDKSVFQEECEQVLQGWLPDLLEKARRMQKNECQRILRSRSDPSELDERITLRSYGERVLGVGLYAE